MRRFEDASVRVKGLKTTPDAATLLKLYGLYKQATAGDVSGERPSALDMRARAKFDAWKALEGLSIEDAQTQYVSLVDDLLARDA